jgi:hypothetical protein
MPLSAVLISAWLPPGFVGAVGDFCRSRRLEEPLPEALASALIANSRHIGAPHGRRNSVSEGVSGWTWRAAPSAHSSDGRLGYLRSRGFRWEAAGSGTKSGDRRLDHDIRCTDLPPYCNLRGRARCIGTAISTSRPRSSARALLRQSEILPLTTISGFLLPQTLPPRRRAPHAPRGLSANAASASMPRRSAGTNFPLGAHVIEPAADRAPALEVLARWDQLDWRAAAGPTGERHRLQAAWSVPFRRRPGLLVEIKQAGEEKSRTSSGPAAFGVPARYRQA